MRILPFSLRRSNRAENCASDWSQDEIADFYRAHRLLVENGAGIGIDRGVSDIGEPWMVFFDGASQDVFLHVARIDNRCHLICDSLDLRLSAANISQLITEFESSVRDLLSIRAERSKNVVIHPAARIIMSISAIFLLFKLETGDAQAKTLSEKTAGGQEGGAGRWNDKVSFSMARAQAAFARVFESTDAPGYVALLAGTIIAGELSRSAVYSANNKQSETSADSSVFVEHAKAETSPLRGDTHSTINTEKADLSEIQTTTSQPKADAEYVATKSSFVSDTPVSETSLKTPDFSEIAISHVEIITDQQRVVVNKESAGATEVEQTKFNKADAPDEAVDVSRESEATKALKELILFTKGDDLSFDTKKDIKIAEKQINEITLSNIDIMDDKVGFFLKTQFEDSKFDMLLMYFASINLQFDHEYVSGKVLVEEKNVEMLADKDIGLWTNVMSDGSMFSVVGHVGLIDDMTSLFS